MPNADPLRAVSDDEERRIQAGIAQDPDNPELTEAQLAALRPTSEVLGPNFVRALTQRRGEQAAAEGAPKKAARRRS